MENHSRGALVSFVLLVLGSTLLPEPCDAWPRGFRPRQSRNAAPEPRCPNCARDCPQNLAGDSISEINEDYQSLSSAQYSPPVPQTAYNTIPASQVYSPPQPLSPYNPSAVIASYTPPPPAATYNSQLPTETYTAPLPAPSYDPRLPPPPCNPPQSLTPPAEVPCYNCPPAAPATFNLLPKSQNRYQPWRRHPSKFNRSPYAVPDYRPRVYSQEASVAPAAPEYECECGCEPKFPLDDAQEPDEDTSFGTYNRRSSEGEAARVSRHYNNAHYAEAPSQSSDMYKTYVPYVREETPNDPATEYASDESERRGRERLYVVYRADALKPEQVSEDRPISERELETVIRKAIEIARQQRTQEIAQRRRANQQYRYDHKPESGAQRPQRQGAPKPIRLVATEAGDEIKNPGLDQNKWIAISALPKSDILVEEEATSEVALKDKAPEVKPTATEARSPKVVELVGDIEVPQRVTESTAFENPTEGTTSNKS